MTTDQRVLKLWAGGCNSVQITERLGITVSHVKLILSSEPQTAVFRAAAERHSSLAARFREKHHAIREFWQPR
jgi:hypothetical protein